MPHTLRFLSQQDLQQLISMPEAIALMADAYLAISSGDAQVPVRAHLKMPKLKAEALYMPVSLDHAKKSGLKVVALNHDNPSRNLPVVQALIMLTDLENGLPIAIMEGSWITALRTGAGSGFATDILARKDTRVAAIFGAGVQARTQLEAISCVRPFQKVYVFNRTKNNGLSFISEQKENYRFPLIYTQDLAHLAEADVICTATTSPDPLFRQGNLKQGVHINAVGAYRADMAEIPSETVLASKLIVDQKEACLIEAGDIIQTIGKGLMDETHIHGELGEIVLGDKEGRNAEQELTLFKSVGNAAQDLVVASFVAQRAMEKGIGTQVNL